MSKIILLITVIVLFITSLSLAFDGDRKGFVLGSGLGVSPNATWKHDGNLFGIGVLKIVDESKSGIGIHLVIGGAFDEHNMLVYKGNYVVFKSDIVNQNLTQGFNGPVFYRYWGGKG